MGQQYSSFCLLFRIGSEFTFAGLDALRPCVIKACVASISACLEPVTAASATTTSARFFRSATLNTPAATRPRYTRHRRRFCGRNADVNTTRKALNNNGSTGRCCGHMACYTPWIFATMPGSRRHNQLQWHHIHQNARHKTHTLYNLLLQA